MTPDELIEMMERALRAALDECPTPWYFIEDSWAGAKPSESGRKAYALLDDALQAYDEYAKADVERRTYFAVEGTEYRYVNKDNAVNYRDSYWPGLRVIRVDEIRTVIADKGTGK